MIISRQTTVETRIVSRDGLTAETTMAEYDVAQLMTDDCVALHSGCPRTVKDEVTVFAWNPQSRHFPAQLRLALEWSNDDRPTTLQAQFRDEPVE
ncbi:hypothetical protein HYG77_37955 (plasmid) [Rhodococcus sp. ZPP]|uniref:hypothetical protein n=1 Tax=Rhodococcus sp. ZPP TaxID=2749906 RepID=UPI001AD89864|nr:hypothetical protein [Rhodococcus sp. ZPP]QTJ71240.1 hypothetical protein HYG77_37955 [Rhodococcus sp. ZPP]